MSKNKTFRLSRNKTEATNKLTYSFAKWNINMLGIEQVQQTTSGT